MLHARIGSHKMPRQSILRFWKFLVVALSVTGFFIFIIYNYSDLFSGSHKMPRQSILSSHKMPRQSILSSHKMPRQSILIGGREPGTEWLKRDKIQASQCPEVICVEDQFSFFIQSGAGSVVPPKICFNNTLVLGASKFNAGLGINVVIMNGKTGDLIQAEHFDMWAGEAKPLIELLQKLQTGSIVFMTSYDEPASKLNEEARSLIFELGSGHVKNLGFRDNWIFVGGKGATTKTVFEKHIKNDQSKNKYDGWPELISLSGCIPKYLG